MENNTSLPKEGREEVLTCVKENPGILLANLIDQTKNGADIIFNLLARKEIYVDMEQELLCEPDRCHVFANEDVALAYQAIITNKKDLMFANCIVDAAPGKDILWGKNLWKIVNMDDQYIFVNSEFGGITTIKRVQFVRMVSEGLIKSADNQLINIVKEKINEKLVGANERDLKGAKRRNDILTRLESGEIQLDNIKEDPRTVRNWKRDFRHGEQVYGSGFIGLIQNIKARGNRTARIPEDTVLAFNRFMDENETPKDQSKIVLYGAFKTACEEKGLLFPSLKTFYKMVNKRSVYERIRNTKGDRAAYSEEPFYYWIDSTTPRHGDRAFEVAHLDHTEADLQTKHSRTRKKLGKFWLTILFDAFTRRVLAFYITFQSPSYISDMMVLRECVSRFGRLPNIIVTDNGKDFKSIYFQSLLACFHVIHKCRPPHKSRFGSVCERYFGKVTEELLHNLRGNTKIMKRVRQVTKYVDPKNWAVWTLPLVYELLKEYFYEEYDTEEHSALGESPQEAFERSIKYSGIRETRYIAYNTFLIMSMPEKKRTGMSKVEGQRGVRVNGFYYYAPELRHYHGEKVPVRYDPWNMGHVYCYVGSHWVECRCEQPTLRNRTEWEIQIASEELRKQAQNTAKNRVIRAQDKAKFLARAEQTEKMLLQREYDEEMRSQIEALNGGTTNPVGTDTYQSNNAPTVVSDVELEEIKKSFIISDIDEGHNGSN